MPTTASFDRWQNMWDQSCRTGTIKNTNSGTERNRPSRIAGSVWNPTRTTFPVRTAVNHDLPACVAPSAGFPVKPMPPQRVWKGFSSPTSPGHLHLRQRVGSRHFPAHPVGSPPTRLVDFRAAFRGLCDHGSSRQNTGQRSGNLKCTTPHTKRPITRGISVWWGQLVDKDTVSEKITRFRGFLGFQPQGVQWITDFACGNNYAKYCNCDENCLRPNRSGRRCVVGLWSGGRPKPFPGPSMPAAYSRRWPTAFVCHRSRDRRCSDHRRSGCAARG